MNNAEVWHYSSELNALSNFTKSLILFKSEERGRERAHIKSFRTILERKINNNPVYESFFEQDKSKVLQVLRYLEKCGEISNLGSGYYSVLSVRHIQLPASRSILRVGELRVKTGEVNNLGLALNVERTIENPIELKDYRFDLDMAEWLLLFKESKKKIELFKEEYFEPTKNGFIKVKNNGNLKEGELYYILSYPPLGDMKEYYVARRVGSDWQGQRVNSYLYKSRLAVLTANGYNPTYAIIQLDNNNKCSLFQIMLSDFLPTVEMEQVYLFSIPEKLKYCKIYYVQQDFIADFIAVLKTLSFVEGNV
ncbi:hypothetical protein [Solibacillus cecembensis]|uniref:hypothetical protein n=1 Tax=Solibacillus cecembensis TaxID=459347 RepID=UPI003D008EF1